MRSLTGLMAVLVLSLAVFRPIEAEGEPSISVKSVDIVPAEVTQGSIYDITVSIELNANQMTFEPNATVILDSNLGTLFETSWGDLSEFTIKQEDKVVATVTITETKLTLKFTDDFVPATEFEFSFTTGERMKAKDVGATEGAPQSYAADD